MFKLTLVSIYRRGYLLEDSWYVNSEVRLVRPSCYPAVRTYNYGTFCKQNTHKGLSFSNWAGTYVVE